jgi:hypothetical protein
MLGSWLITPSGKNYLRAKQSPAKEPLQDEKSSVFSLDK